MQQKIACKSKYLLLYLNLLDEKNCFYGGTKQRIKPLLKIKCFQKNLIIYLKRRC